MRELNPFDARFTDFRNEEAPATYAAWRRWGFGSFWGFVALAVLTDLAGLLANDVPGQPCGFPIAGVAGGAHGLRHVYRVECLPGNLFTIHGLAARVSQKEKRQGDGDEKISRMNGLRLAHKLPLLLGFSPSIVALA